MKIKKTSIIRQSKLLALLAVFILSSCSTEAYWKLKIEIPRKRVIDLDRFEEVIITDFLIKKEINKFNINKELVDYLTSELGQSLDKKISPEKIDLKEEETFENEEYWKNLFLGSKETLILTGNVDYAEETRKAIIEKEKKQFNDPFPAGSRFVSRKFYSLNLDIYLIDSESGKTLYKRKFKETKSYENPNQTACFAFFDLIRNVKLKLFPNLLGEEQVQERYILSK